MCFQEVHLCENCGTSVTGRYVACAAAQARGGFNRSCANFVERSLARQCQRPDCLAMPRRWRDESEVQRSVENLSTNPDGSTRRLFNEVMIPGAGSYLPRDNSAHPVNFEAFNQNVPRLAHEASTIENPLQNPGNIEPGQVFQIILQARQQVRATGNISQELMNGYHHTTSGLRRNADMFYEMDGWAADFTRRYRTTNYHGANFPWGPEPVQQPASYWRGDLAAPQARSNVGVIGEGRPDGSRPLAEIIAEGEEESKIKRSFAQEEKEAEEAAAQAAGNNTNTSNYAASHAHVTPLRQAPVVPNPFVGAGTSGPGGPGATVREGYEPPRTLAAHPEIRPPPGLTRVRYSSISPPPISPSHHRPQPDPAVVQAFNRLTHDPASMLYNTTEALSTGEISPEHQATFREAFDRVAADAMSSPARARPRRVSLSDFLLPDIVEAIDDQRPGAGRDPASAPVGGRPSVFGSAPPPPAPLWFGPAPAPGFGAPGSGVAGPSGGGFGASGSGSGPAGSGAPQQGGTPFGVGARARARGRSGRMPRPGMGDARWR